MSLIVHRCTTCTHPDIFHNPRDNSCSHAQCESGRHQPEWSEPEILSTWLTGSGEPVEQPAEPGSIFRGFGLLTVDLCGCESCMDLYRRSAA